MNDDAPLRIVPGGLDLFVRVTPRAAADRLGAVSMASDGRIRLAAVLRAVPEKGRANADLCRLLATALRVPQTAVRVLAGQTSRLKTVRIEGEPHQLEARIRTLLGG